MTTLKHSSLYSGVCVLIWFIAWVGTGFWFVLVEWGGRYLALPFYCSAYWPLMLLGHPHSDSVSKWRYDHRYIISLVGWLVVAAFVSAVHQIIVSSRQPRPPA